MSQFVEGRIGDFLGAQSGAASPAAARPFTSAPRPVAAPAPRPVIAAPVAQPSAFRPVQAAQPSPVRPVAAAPVVAPVRAVFSPPPRPPMPIEPPKPVGPTERTKVSGSAKAKAEEVLQKRTGNVFNF
jgi:hypothetical protein